MPKPVARVGVNGFGVIGKRVAEAVSKQKDMKLIGVSDVVADYRVKMGQKKNFAIYSSIPEKLPDMKKAGIEVSGVLEDLIKKVDVMIDCTQQDWAPRTKRNTTSSASSRSFRAARNTSLPDHRSLPSA